MIGHILKNKQKNKSVCFKEIVKINHNKNGDGNEVQITWVRHKWMYNSGLGIWNMTGMSGKTGQAGKVCYLLLRVY